MSKYRFEQIVINSTEKKKPTEEDKYTYLGLEHLDSGSLHVTRYGSDVAPIGEKLIMREGDVLFGKRRAYQKKVAIAPFDGIFSAHGMVLRPKEKVIDKNFFPLFIGSDYFLDAAIKISVGSLSPTINWRDLKELEFELPDMDKQRELAKVLWAMDATKKSYQKLLLKTDELVNAQFIEMFGDPESNTMGWDVKKLGEIFDIGSSKRVFQSEWKYEGVPFYRAREIVKLSQDGYVDNELFISEEMFAEYSEKYGIPQAGDIMVTGVGTLGICYLVKSGDRFYFKDGNIIWLKKKSEVSSEYVYYSFKLPYVRKQIQNGSTGTTVGTYTIVNAKNTRMLFPPLELQNQFADFVIQTDKSKAELEQALTELTAAYKKIISENLG